MKKTLLTFIGLLMTFCYASAASVTFEQSEFVTNPTSAKTKDGVTITLAANGGTAPKYYDDGVRVYKGNKITINGTDITSVSFVISEASRKGNLVFSPEATSSINGTDITISLKSPANEFVITNGGTTNVQLRFTSVTITTAEGSGKEQANLSFGETDTYNANLGEPFEAPKLSNPNNLAVSYDSSNKAVATVAENGDVTIISAGKTEISAESAETEEFYAGQAKYTLIVTDPNAKPYTLVTDVAQLGDAARVLIVCKSKPAAMGAISTTSTKYGTSVDISSQISDDKATIEPASGAEYSIFVVEKGSNEGDYTFKYEGTDNYLTNTGSTGKMSTTTTVPKKSTLAIDNTGNATITLSTDGTTSYAIRYNITSPRFACYNATNQTAVQLYYVGAVREEAGLSFTPTTVEAKLGQAFELPKLTNPHNLAVTYASENEAVATVDPNTGEVKIVAEGTTIITATSAETEEFIGGKAQYTLNVVDPDAVTLLDATFSETIEPLSLVGEGADKIWTIDAAYHCLKGTSFGITEGSYTLPAIVVTPEIDLTNMQSVNCSYITKAAYFGANATFTTDCEVVVREGADGEWTAVPFVCAGDNPENAGNDRFAEHPTTVDLSSYLGKKIQLGFRYNAPSTSSIGTWEIMDLLINGKKKNDQTSVTDIDADVNAPVEFYNLQGVRVSGNEPGLYIRRQGTNVTKVLVK